MYHRHHCHPPVYQPGLASTMRRWPPPWASIPPSHAHWRRDPRHSCHWTHHAGRASHRALPSRVRPHPGRHRALASRAHSHPRLPRHGRCGPHHQRRGHACHCRHHHGVAATAPAARWRPLAAPWLRVPLVWGCAQGRGCHLVPGVAPGVWATLAGAAALGRRQHLGPRMSWPSGASAASRRLVRTRHTPCTTPPPHR